MEVANFFRAQSELDLYFMIAKEVIGKDKLKIKQIITEGQIIHREQLVANIKQTIDPRHKTDHKKTEAIIIGDDNVEMDYSLAKCCSPLPGDEILGFITIGEGIKIHRTNCKNAISLMSQYGYRVLKAHWASDTKLVAESYETLIRITGIDGVGIVSKVTDIISKDLQVNMKSISFESHDGLFDGKLNVYLTDTSHLQVLIDKIKSIDNYIHVTRHSVD